MKYQQTIEQIRAVNFEVLEQLRQVINGASHELYSQGNHLNQYGVGRHVRHILDYYLALQKGVVSGQVDYNQRNRDALAENDKPTALQLINDIVAWINTLDEDKDINIISEVSLQQYENTIIQSSLLRELYYLMEHTMHHLAYVALFLKVNGIVLDNDIGLAPATKSHQRRA